MHKSRRFTDRYFWLAVGLIFAVLFAPLMFREWLSLRTEGLYTVEWHTAAMASLLQQDLESHHPLLEILAQLDDREHFAEFDRLVKQRIGHLGLLNVKIYDSAGKMIYVVAGDGGVGQIFPETGGLKTALSGQVSSTIIERDAYLKEYGQEIGADMAEVYVPLVSKPDGGIPFVLEAYYDHSAIMARTRSLLIQRGLSLLGTTLVVLGLLIYLYIGRQRMGRQLKALEAILPICMYCKKIRLDEPARPEQWMQIESYFAEQDDLAFSHGICPACLQQHHPGSKAAREKRE